MATFTRTESSNTIRLGRIVRLALASAFLLTSVACGWVEGVDPPIASSEFGNEDTATPPSSPSNPSNDPQTPQTPPPSVDPPAVAAYAVRWNPSASAGVIGYWLTVREAASGSTRIVDIPLSAARSVGSNVLQREINLETDRDHVLSLRAYDGSTHSPPSNEIVVRASALIASAMAGAPSAATSGDASTSTTSSPSTATASVESGTSADASASADLAVGDARELMVTSEAFASIAFAGEGDHLEGVVSDAPGSVMAGLDAGADAGTLAVWLRPFLDDSPRRVLVSLAAAADADFDRLELAIIEGGDVELTLRDDAGRIGRQVHFAAALQTDVWQHMALVFDPHADALFTLRVDGAGVPAAVTAAAELGAMPPVGLLRIGAGLEGESFAGRMGHVALWSRALDSDELLFASIRGHDLDLCTDAMGTELAHYWRLGEGDGELELDLAGVGTPIDLTAPNGDLALVEDGPLPLE